MQVNRNNALPYFEQSAAQASWDSDRDDRRAVKKIASSIDSDLRKLGRQGFFSTNVKKISGIRDRIQANQLQLAALHEQGLDHVAPPQTALRKARSAVVLGTGMVGRSGAIVGASVTGIIEGGAVAAALPVVGTVSGLQSGAAEGAQMCGGYLFPVTVPVGAALGAANGAIGGVVAGVVMAPVKVALKGSYTRSTFSLLDPYSKAKAHVARKSMSTEEIADEAALKAAKALAKADEQREQAQLLRDAPALLRNTMKAMLEEVRNSED